MQSEHRSRKPHGRLRLVVAVLLSVIVLGCGKGNPATIQGKITFQRKPVEQGDITFTRPGNVAQGEINRQGEYVLKLSDKGLAPGEYKVVVSPTSKYENVQVGERTEVKLVLLGAQQIPGKYHSETTTLLQAKVTGGNDTFDFELQP